MTVLYPNLCYNEVCYIGTALSLVKGIDGLAYSLSWPLGYKTFFMLNSTEHKISTENKNLNTDK